MLRCVNDCETEEFVREETKVYKVDSGGDIISAIGTSELNFICPLCDGAAVMED